LGGKREAKVGVTDTENGLDIVIEGVRPTPATLGAFAGKAASLGLARLTADGESIAPGDPPEIDLSGARVRLPPGAFLQASGAAEAVLVGLVREGLAARSASPTCSPGSAPSPSRWRATPRRCLRGRRSGASRS
jgi:23S rRNA (uracil1939-C5)-methyltransferase